MLPFESTELMHSVSVPPAADHVPLACAFICPVARVDVPGAVTSALLSTLEVEKVPSALKVSVPSLGAAVGWAILRFWRIHSAAPPPVCFQVPTRHVSIEGGAWQSACADRDQAAGSSTAPIATSNA